MSEQEQQQGTFGFFDPKVRRRKPRPREVVYVFRDHDTFTPSQRARATGSTYYFEQADKLAHAWRWPGRAANDYGRPTHCTHVREDGSTVSVPVPP